MRPRRPWHGRPYREIVARVHTHGLSFAGLSVMAPGVHHRDDVPDLGDADQLCCVGLTVAMVAMIF